MYSSKYISKFGSNANLNSLHAKAKPKPKPKPISEVAIIEPSLLKKVVEKDDEILELVEEGKLALISPEEVLTTDQMLLAEGAFGRIFEVQAIDLLEDGCVKKGKVINFDRRSQMTTGLQGSSTFFEESSDEEEEDEKENLQEKLIMKLQEAPSTPTTIEMTSSTSGGDSQKDEDEDDDEERNEKPEHYQQQHTPRSHVRPSSSHNIRSMSPLRVEQRKSPEKYAKVGSFITNTSDFDTRKQRFVIKICKDMTSPKPNPNMSDEVFHKQLVYSALDLGNEAALLASISHPNIVKLHALSTRSILSPKFFILIEHVPMMLEKKWKIWREKASHPTFGSMMKSRAKKQELEFASMKERINEVIIGITNAFAYLHSKRIVYRDLKKGNIGMTEDGVIKVFDFGLAKRLPAAQNSSDDDEVFKLSFVGSPRYMAPEVVKNKPYNCKADVYSVGVLLWEICSLEQSFSDVPPMQFHKRIRSDEIKLDPLPHWPERLQVLLRKCLNRNYLFRIKCSELLTELQKL